MTGPPGNTAEDAKRWWRAYQLAEAGQVAELQERAGAGDEHARLQLARWLADGDRLGELRQRAASGSYHALHELADWLARHEHLDELRALVVDHRELLASWLARQHDMRVVRVAAELGDDAAARRLEHWLTRLRRRADAGHESARRFLAENPDWRQLLAGHPEWQ